MLFETLHKIHERPLSERRRIAFWLAFLLTLLIAVVWGLTILIRTSGKPADVQAIKAPSPFENLWEGLGEGFASFKKYFPKEVVK